MALKMSAAKIKLAKVGGICAAAGLVIGIVGTLFFSNYNPPDKGVPENASVVFGRIVEQNELVSVSQDYNIVDKQSDASSFFGLFDLPFTGNSFWYRYAGTIKAGVNLETAEIDDQGDRLSRWAMSMSFCAGASSKARSRRPRAACLRRLRPRRKLRFHGCSTQPSATRCLSSTFGATRRPKTLESSVWNELSGATLLPRAEVLEVMRYGQSRYEDHCDLNRWKGAS